MTQPLTPEDRASLPPPPAGNAFCAGCREDLPSHASRVSCPTCGAPFHIACWRAAAPKGTEPPGEEAGPEEGAETGETVAGTAVPPPLPGTGPVSPAAARPGEPNGENGRAGTAWPSGRLAATRNAIATGGWKELWYFIKKNETLLWWLHSGWALLFGIGVMWLGAKNFEYLRIAGLYIVFIWFSSIILPFVLNRLKTSEKWKERVRLVINYFNRNFTQQIIFFIIPIYWKSATGNSRNMLFILLLVISAILSSLDIVYDRYLSVKWAFFNTFFAFNIFSGTYLLFTLIWGLSNTMAIYFSAGLAIFGFASLTYRMSGYSRLLKWVVIVISSTCLFLAAHFGRFIIPPAPLHFGRVIFAEEIFVEKNLDAVVRSALSDLPPAKEGGEPTKVFTLIPIKAPLGLRENLVQSYYLNGKQIPNVDFVKPPKDSEAAVNIHPIGMVNGEVLWKVRPRPVLDNRTEQYMLISFVSLYHIPPKSVLQVDVETESGQLIGRDELVVEE